MNLFLRILFLFYFINSFTQSSQFGEVQYGQKESLGLGAPIGIDYNALLVFNDKESIYTYAKDSLEGGHVFEYKNIKKNNASFVMAIKSTTQDGYNYYHDFLNRKYENKDIGGKYVKGNLTKIAWSIHGESKLIGGFNCTKATGKFGGRNYTVWFTTEIPLPYGPWKLQGLPGLILEGYDTNMEIYFYFKSINYPVKNRIVIDRLNPGNKEWLSSSDYKSYLINTFNRAVENGRMMAEQSGMPSQPKKILMKNYFIEFYEE